MPSPTKRRHRRGILVAAAVTLAASTAACDDGSGDLPPPPATPPATDTAPTPTSTLSPRDAEATQEILAAFDSYMEALIELSTAGVPGGTEETLDRLEDVPVSSEAYFELADELLTRNAMAGHSTSGTITWDAEVAEIDWENTFPANPGEVFPEAMVRACLDETGWSTVDKETGEVVEGPGGRYVSIMTVTWSGEDPIRPELEPRWEITVRDDMEEPC